ncbi:uncharacterized protein [Maniola hyperantus]
MPKRRRDEDKKRHIAAKIRRLERRPHQMSDSSSDEDSDGSDRQSPRHRTPPIESDSEIPILPLSDSDHSMADNTRPKSVVIPAQNPESQAELIPAVTTSPIPAPVPNTSALPVSPPEMLEALGDPKPKDEVFGPGIPEEIAKRWGRVLADGLTKEQKEQINEKYFITDNFRLAKAPMLNPEITHVLSESARSRDKLMEKAQNQLGRGISELTYLATTVIKEDLSKTEMLKKISDASQIFLDLHYEDTKRRRKLVTVSLDKKFFVYGHGCEEGFLSFWG